MIKGFIMKKIYASVFVLAACVAACTVMKNDKLDKDAEGFLTEFKSVLSKSDSEILALFYSGQSEEEILKGVAVLQNKNQFVSTRIRYAEATGKWEDGYLLIDLPVEIVAEGEEKVVKHLALKLVQKKAGKFYINRFGGDEVYTAYQSLKYKVENRDLLAKRLQELKVYYDRAMQLQKNYDSVVWYTQYKDTTYYFAVNGTFVLDSLNGKSPATSKMGLVHENGKVVIPVEYDLIGNPSINMADAVEVKRDGKVGYFDLTGKMLVPAEYTWVVPYDEGESKALVKKDTVFGWLDAAYQFHENFPTEKAEKYIREFTYLTEKKFVFGTGTQTMLEMFTLPDSKSLYPTSLAVIPAFLSENGVFNKVEYGFISRANYDSEYFIYGNEYIENQNEKPFSISETIDIFISNFKTRYIGGRGELYATHSITVVDKATNTTNSISTEGDYDFNFKRLTENLFESKFRTDIMGPDDILEQNFPDYNYFSFDGSKLSQLPSNRRFKFTQFLKLDSSYLSGNFETFDTEKGTEGQSTFLSEGTLNLIRYEILADNHFAINDQKMLDNFKHFNWYQPSISSYEEVYAKASEIDKYNLDFLARILGPIAKPI